MTDRRSFLTAALAAPAMLVAPVAIANDGSFHQAVAKFRQMRAVYDNHPGHCVMAGDPDYRALADGVTAMCREVSKQFDAVMRIPAPDMMAVATKLELVLEEYQDFEMPNEAVGCLTTVNPDRRFKYHTIRFTKSSVPPSRGGSHLARVVG